MAEDAIKMSNKVILILTGYSMLPFINTGTLEQHPNGIFEKEHNFENMRVRLSVRNFMGFRVRVLELGFYS